MWFHRPIHLSAYIDRYFFIDIMCWYGGVITYTHAKFISTTTFVWREKWESVRSVIMATTNMRPDVKRKKNHYLRQSMTSYSKYRNEKIVAGRYAIVQTTAFRRMPPGVIAVNFIYITSAKKRQNCLSYRLIRMRWGLAYNLCMQWSLKLLREIYEFIALAWSDGILNCNTFSILLHKYISIK